MNRQQRRAQARALRKPRADGLAPRVSQRPERAGSLSREQRAAKVNLLERVDNFSGVRNMLKDVAARDCEWAGIPMPIEGQRLIIEPTYPRAKELAEIGQKPTPAVPKEIDGAKVRNSFYSSKKRCDIVIIEKDGKIDWGLIPAVHHFTHDLMTLGASVAWGIEQEAKALQLLGTLIRHHQFKYYLMTGMFMERSTRSGLTYMFRKNKPTVVVDAREKGAEDCRILCCLCMHPIAYYEGSWAGAMCPTDDVIAHLMLMRGDEPMLWRRANQHAPHRPEAGL